MKKALLLSVVASSMIMAGGDIAPVEPAVETPAPVVSGWEFGGTATVYYQTDDSEGDFSGTAGVTGDVFDQEASSADAGFQLRAMNSDVVAGIGAGLELSGLATLNLENGVVSNVMQAPMNGGWISQLYLTYGFGNTSIKAGRQELPKALSPFAYSEKWNVFSNTFDAVLVVNSDLPDTVLVGAWVYRNNVNGMAADMSAFNRTNAGTLMAPGSTDGVFMLTAQNKSIENLTLTGSWYFGNEFITANNLNILWGDAAYDASSFNVGIQGGAVMHDDFDKDDLVAFGAKVGTEFSGVNLMAAYSNVNDGGLTGVVDGMFQLGGTTSALYTNTVANQLAANALEQDADKFVVSAGAAVLGGNISGAYAYTDSDVTNDTNEFDLVYSTNLAGIDLTAAYVYLDADAHADSENVVRLVGSYNF